MVSVIIPVYNRGWIFSQAIDSVLDQSFIDFELIVVDDGSTDGSDKQLAAYGDRIVLIRQENKGVSAARNRGIAAASGRFIALLDSDDTWLPEKLARQVDFFNRHPKALICQTQEIWIRNGVRVNPKTYHKKPSGMIFEPSLALCLVSPSAVMMKKSLLDEVGLFDESLRACEDYDLWLRVSKTHPIYLIDDPLVVKRGGHDDQLSRKPGLDKYRIQSLNQLIETGHLTASQKKAAVDMLKKKCRIYGKGCEKRGKIDEAQTYFRIADQFK